MIVLLVKILETLFIVGVVGCLITIPLAGWGYASVLFEKNVGTDARSADWDELAPSGQTDPQPKGAD